MSRKSAFSDYCEDSRLVETDFVEYRVAYFEAVAVALHLVDALHTIAETIVLKQIIELAGYHRLQQ